MPKFLPWIKVYHLSSSSSTYYLYIIYQWVTKSVMYRSDFVYYSKQMCLTKCMMYLILFIQYYDLYIIYSLNSAGFVHIQD